MIPAPAALSTHAGQFERLVAEGRYDEAQRVFEAYCRILDEVLRGVPAGDPRIRQMEEEWNRLVDDTRRRVLAGRAHAALRLGLLSPHRQLYGQPLLARHTWQCLA